MQTCMNFSEHANNDFWLFFFTAYRMAWIPSTFLSKTQCHKTFQQLNMQQYLISDESELKISEA